jgi:cold shock CspA family protein
MKDELQQGKIKQYDSAKGFGFIGYADGDIFFHISDFPQEDGTQPKRNERVQFVAQRNGEKFKAVKIQRVEDQSKKAVKTRVAKHNKSITSALLNNFRG